MAPQHALVALLTLASTAAAQYYTSRTSVYWTATERYAAFATESPYTRANGQVTMYTDTDYYRTVKPSVTLSASPTSSTTSMDYYDDVKIVSVFYGIGAVTAESDLEPEPTYDYSATTTSVRTYSSIDFYMPVEMTAPSSCPTPFTISTTATVTIPSEVWSQITPTSTGSMSTSLGSSGNYEYVYQDWYLSAGAAPFYSNDDFTYSWYVASCSTPPAARTSGSYNPGSTLTSGGGSGSDDTYGGSFCSGYSSYSYYGYCYDGLKVWIIVVASVIPGLFLLGFLESWFWYRRLMMGKSAMRFGTICWILMSLWVLCFTRMQDARSKDDQKMLQEKWKHMSSGTAFKLWWKIGFKHKYPVEHLGQFSRQTVGIVPAGQPLNPAMAQVQPTFMPGMQPPPPGAPGAPGQVYYYGPPPPGWVPTPDGHGFMPPQGYMYPPPQQAGYYGSDVAKDRSVASASPVSAVGPQHPMMAPPPQDHSVSPVGSSPPQLATPQPSYPLPNFGEMGAPSPPPQGPVPTIPQQQASAPPHIAEAPVNTASNAAPAPPPPAHRPNNRDLYE